MMKHTVTTLLLLISILSFSQEDEGYFQFSIDLKAMDTSLETRQSISMLKDSKMELYYTETKSRVDFKMGSMFNTSVRIDQPNDRAVTLTKSPMGDFASEVSIAELKAANSQQIDTNTTVQLVDEEKVILGFNCKKALLNSHGKISVYWYTNEITVDIKEQTILNPYVPGFPLSFSSIENGMLMTFTASNYSFEIENKEEVFSLDVPEGYQKF